MLNQSLGFSLNLNFNQSLCLQLIHLLLLSRKQNRRFGPKYKNSLQLNLNHCKGLCLTRKLLQTIPIICNRNLIRPSQNILLIHIPLNKTILGPSNQSPTETLQIFTQSLLEIPPAFSQSQQKILLNFNVSLLEIARIRTLSLAKIASILTPSPREITLVSQNLRKTILAFIQSPIKIKLAPIVTIHPGTIIQDLIRIIRNRNQSLKPILV